MRKSLKSLMAILFVVGLSCQLFAADGVITFVKGKVEVKRGDSWVALNVGDSVKQSEMINTGFQSEAKVKLMDSILYLGPVTRVTLDTLASSADKDKVNVFLTTGSVRSKVNRTETKRVSYTVRTPIAVASVRGTDWAMDCLNNVQCYEGGVAVIPVNLLKDLMKKAGMEEESEKLGESEDDGIEMPDLPDSDDDIDLTNSSSLEAFEDTLELPTTGVVVGADMNLQVFDASTMATPTHVIETNVNKVLSAVTTESSKVVESGLFTPGPAQTVNKNLDGSLAVNINKPEFGNLDVEVILP